MIYNRYWYFKEIISPEQCQQIIDLGLSTIEKNKNEGISVAATTFGNTHKQGQDSSAVPQEDKTQQELKSKNIKKSYIRDSEVAWLNDQWLYDLFAPLIQRANVSAGWNFDLESGEKFQFTVYKPGGFYGWHNDSGMCHFSKYKRIIPGITPVDENGNYAPGYIHSSASEEYKIGRVRKLSCTINLNSPGEYEGGNLKFDFGAHSEVDRFHECKEIRPQGSMIVFPSFLEHQVTPVTSGTRYSLVLWSIGKPFR